MTDLEKQEEDEYVKQAAIQLGCLALKFKHEGIKGAPDRIVLVPDRKPLFIEFKRPDGKGIISPHQINFADQLRDFGYTVLFCMSCETALRLTKEYIEDD